MSINVDPDIALDYGIVKEEPIDDEPEDVKPVDLLYDVKYETLQILQNENKALAEKLEEKNQSIAKSKSHIEQMEQRRKQSISDSNVLNRHWNLFDENMRILLQKFDHETTEAVKSGDDTDVASPYLYQLQTLDKDELDEKLTKRMDASLQSLLKVVEAFDKHMIRGQNIARAVKEEIDKDEVLQEANSILQKENPIIQELNKSLKSSLNEMTLKLSTLQDYADSKDTEIEELRNQIDDLECENVKVQERIISLQDDETT
ncbi:E3 ubiquitin-protein ligase Bre1-like [Adelges cooleyi]|uniref:E3 ubiquitin-protein ligase Bre1-like n=1 Tax=Adelges cooleyi TaxID=133065 RepID=UPI00217F2D80|nr:E3 ubiquitin-protein ligase Bre1-like [Adelges cooleyi]